MSHSSASSDTPISFELLDACCREVAERVDKKPVPEWTTLEYKRLSGMLNRETEILLSESTLKRIFGRLKTSERYFPQKATRDALAKFIGYRDWQELELVHQAKKNATVTPERAILPVEEAAPVNDVSLIPPVPEQPIAVTVIDAPAPAKKKKRFFGVAVAVAAALLLLSAVWMLRPSDGFDKVKHLQLQCLNPIGEVPHSALFQLVSPSPLPPEAADLDMSWGEHKFSQPFKNSRVVNHLYQYPGVQYAILSYKGTPIDTVTVQMRTKGWVANAINELDSVRVFPVQNLKLLNPDNLYASIPELAGSGVDTLDAFVVGFSNIKPSTIDGDNFELDVRVQASEIRTGARCPYVLILVQGERDQHYVRITLPNCTALTNYKFSEVYADGENTDLRHLSLDLRKGADVTLRIDNKHAALTVDGKLFQEAAYEHSIGKIIGLKFAANGTGRIMHPVLSDLKTGEKY